MFFGGRVRRDMEERGRTDGYYVSVTKCCVSLATSKERERKAYLIAITNHQGVNTITKKKL